MKTVEDLNRALRTALRSAKVTQRDIADHLGFKAHSAISRKLRGEQPWTYEEVVKVVELLGTPNLACDEVTPAAPDDPLAYIIADVLLHLSAKDRSQMLSMMGWFLEAKAKTPKERAKVKILQSLARSLKTDSD